MFSYNTTVMYIIHKFYLMMPSIWMYKQDSETKSILDEKQHLDVTNYHVPL